MMDIIVTAAWAIVVLCGLAWVIDNTPIGKPIKAALAAYVATKYPQVKNARLFRDMPPQVRETLEKKRHRGRHS